MSFVGSNTRPSDALRETSGLRFGLLAVTLATPPAHSAVSTWSARAARVALLGSVSGSASDAARRSAASAEAWAQRLGSVTPLENENLVDVALSVRLGARKPPSTVP